MKKMKKSILVNLMLILIIGNSFLMSSCKKELENNKTIESKKIEEDLNQMAIKYRVKNNRYLKMTESEKRLVAAGADLSAAADFISSTWGLSVIPGAGFAVGAACGVVATAASIAAYHSCGISINGGDSTIISNILNNSNNYTVANPYNNPYENVGIRHNQLIKIYFSGSKRDTLISNVTLIFDSTQLNSEEITSLSKVPDSVSVSIYNYFRNNVITTEYGIQPALNNFFINSEDYQLKNIISTFYNNLKTINTLTETISYINDCENYFINCNSISCKTKNVLLTCFAVAKHSYTLWYMAITN